MRARDRGEGGSVLAAAEGGEEEGGRKRDGRALMIDPWGERWGEGGCKGGCVSAGTDAVQVTGARAKIRCLDHDGGFE